jgi:hypothetical protein
MSVTVQPSSCYVETINIARKNTSIRLAYVMTARHIICIQTIV